MNKKILYHHARVNNIKELTPREDFYSFYSDEHIRDIINSIEVQHEIPRQYNYFNKGAEHWENYVKRLATENIPNTLNVTQQLLKINKDYIKYLLRDHTNIDVVDVGAGNAYPVKDLLKDLSNSSKLRRYVALDISISMLELAKNNIATWFQKDIVFEGYEYDVTKDRFSNLLVNNGLEGTSDGVANLVLLLGGTLSNIKLPDNAYKMIHDSMSLNDILIHVTKLDTESNRKYFDFGASNRTALSASHRFIFELLNIDKSYYDVETGFNQTIKERYIRVRFNTAMRLEFKLKHKRRSLFLERGDTILVWRGIHHTKNSIIEQFDRNGFNLMHINLTNDQSYALTMARIKSIP